ncbi:MAG: WD40 repeat domain-containing protein [Candidatus Acidiferrales bacterium]
MLVLLRSSKPLCALGLLLVAGCSGSGKSSTPPPAARSVAAQVPPVTIARNAQTGTPVMTQFAANGPANPASGGNNAPDASAVSISIPISPGAGYAGTHGKRVLIDEAGTLLVMDPDGANRRKIAENAGAAAFSPDGNLVAYADKQGVYVLSLLDGQSVSLAKFTEGDVSSSSVAWSPDQKHLAYDGGVRMKSWDLFLASYPPAGDAPRNLGHWYESVSFSPNGKFIVHPSFDETGAPGPPAILETVNVETGKRETIYKGITTIWEAKYSPDGSSIAFMMTDPKDDESQNDSGGAVIDLWILHLDSKKAERIMRGVYDFDWSPDGRFLAIGTGSEEGDYPPDDAAVFISSADGKVQFQLSKDGPSLRAMFSPDSKEVMFVDFNDSRLVIGDLATRKLIPLPGLGRGGGLYVVCDWK